MATENKTRIENFINNSIGFWLNHTATAIREYAESQFIEENLKVTEAAVVMVLSVHKTVPLVELSKKMKYSHPSVLRHIDSLEKAGIVQRIPHPEDRRVKLLSLTEKGVDIVPRVQQIFFNVHDYCKSAFDEGDDIKIVELLKKLYAKLVPDDEWLANHIKLQTENKK